MIGRLLKGLIIGLILGGAVGAGLHFGAGMLVMGGLVAYAVALGVGVLVGLVAGKPIWAQDGKIEAGLKAVFGALIAAGAMFALRRWGNLALPISLPTPGGPQQLMLATSPLSAIPLITTALALFFEIDNTPAPAVSEKSTGVRVATSSSSANLDDEELEEQSASKAKKLKR